MAAAQWCRPSRIIHLRAEFCFFFCCRFLVCAGVRWSRGYDVNHTCGNLVFWCSLLYARYRFSTHFPFPAINAQQTKALYGICMTECDRVDYIFIQVFLSVSRERFSVFFWCAVRVKWTHGWWVVRASVPRTVGQNSRQQWHTHSKMAAAAAVAAMAIALAKCAPTCKIACKILRKMSVSTRIHHLPLFVCACVRFRFCAHSRPKVQRHPCYTSVRERRRLPLPPTMLSLHRQKQFQFNRKRSFSVF